MAKKIILSALYFIVMISLSVMLIFTARAKDSALVKADVLSEMEILKTRIVVDLAYIDSELVQVEREKKRLEDLKLLYLEKQTKYDTSVSVLKTYDLVKK